MTWLHSFLPIGAFQPDHHHTEKWSAMKLLFEYRRFHLDWALIFVRRFRSTVWMDGKWGPSPKWTHYKPQIKARSGPFREIERSKKVNSPLKLKQTVMKTIKDWWGHQKVDGANGETRRSSLCKWTHDLTRNRPLYNDRPLWTGLKITTLPIQLNKASLRIRVTTADGSGFTFSRWKILTGKPVGDKHVTLYGPLASLGNINSPDTFVANIFSSPWSNTEKNKVSSLQTG